MSQEKLEAKIKEFDTEVNMVISWASNEVKKRMITAAAEANLRLRDHHVSTFEDIRDSWKQDGSRENVARIYAICYGDYEGTNSQYWSRHSEVEYMRIKNLEYNTKTSLREKGCYEKCISKAKGNLVRQILSKSATTHQAKVVLSLKNDRYLPDKWKDKFQAARNVKAEGGKSSVTQDRRKKGEFFLKEKVSPLTTQVNAFKCNHKCYNPKP